jgi:hypothetical protein
MLLPLLSSLRLFRDEKCMERIATLEDRVRFNHEDCSEICVYKNLEIFGAVANNNEV